MIELENDFHNTFTKVRPKDMMLSPWQVRKVEKALCGMDDCICGTISGGEYYLDYLPDGGAEILKRWE